MGWGTWGRFVRATLAAGFAAGVLLSAAPASAATVPAVPTEAECGTWLGPDLLADIEARGYIFSAVNDSPLFSGTECWWGNPDSPRIAYFGFGIAELTEDEADAEAQTLLATGDWAVDPADTSIIRADQESAPDQASLINPSWRFQYAEGYWIFVVDGEAQDLIGTDAVLDDWTDTIAQTVLANLAPEPEPDPEPQTEVEPVEDSGPVPVAAPDGFTAETPSTLRGLRTLTEVDVTPLGIGGCLAAAVVLVALIGLPGRLVESAIVDRYDEWSRVAGPWQRWRARVETRLARVPRAVVIGAGLVVASVFAALIEPELGWNGGSARLILTLLSSFLLENLLGLALVGWWLTRRGHATSLQLKPGSLAIVLVSALVSRWVGFEPGFVFGLVLILIVLVARSDAGERDQSLAESAWILILGVIAWLGYSAAVAGSLDTAGVAGLFATEVMAGLAVGCLSALPLLALPIGGMPGAALWRWRKRVWAVVQAAAIAAFVFIVLPLPASWSEVDTPFAVWIGLFALYAAGAVLLWLVLRFVPVRPRQADLKESERR